MLMTMGAYYKCKVNILGDQNLYSNIRIDGKNIEDFRNEKVQMEQETFYKVE